MNSRGPIRTALVIGGSVLIALSAIWLVGGLAGLLPVDVAAVAGHSALRGIVSIAVVGCVLAAIGSWDN